MIMVMTEPSPSALTEPIVSPIPRSASTHSRASTLTEKSQLQHEPCAIQFTKNDVEKALPAADPPSKSPVVAVDEEYYPEGGRGWWVILGCLIVAAVIMGWPIAWGVFQTYYKKHVFPDVSDTILSLLGTLQNLVMTITAFVSGKLGDRFGYKRFIAIGSCFAVAGLIGAAFSSKLWHFFITQGIMPGLAVGLVFPMIVAYPSQWFKRKRALTTGIVVAGSSLGGGATSLILRAMLNYVSLRNTFLIYAGINGSLLAVAFLLIKTRGPKRNIRVKWVDGTLFRDPIFWSVAGAMLFCTFGFLPPIIFIAPYTVEKVPNISTQLSIAPVAVLGFSMAFGRTLIGHFGDRVGVTNAFIISTLLSAASQLLVWMFAESFTTIILFAVIQGAFGGCFISLIAPVSAQLFGADRLATLSGLLILFNAPGNIAGAPLYGALLDATKRNWRVSIGVSGGFQILGAASILYARLKRQPKLMSIF